MYHTFDYRLHSGTPQFRLPAKLSWFYYAFWALFIALLGFGFLFLYNYIATRTRLELLLGTRDAAQIQSLEYEAKINKLKESSRQKDMWMPFVSSRPTHARLLAKMVEALPPNMRMDALEIRQEPDPATLTLQLGLVVSNTPTELAQQKVAEFRAAFRTLAGYTLEANEDNSSGVSRPMRVRGQLVNEYRVRETWTFRLARKSDDQVYTNFKVLNNSHPLK